MTNLLAIFISMTVLAAIVGFMLQRRRVYRLDWPAKMDYYGLKRRTRQYLTKNGWTITSKLHDISYDYKAEKNNASVILLLFPTDMTINSSKLRDVREIRKTMGYSRPIVCVTADIPPEETVTEAAAKKLHVLHYKELPRLESIPPIK